MYHKPFKYGLNSTAIKNIAKQSSIYTEKEVKEIIKDLLNEVLELTLEDLKQWILKFVPKRTGQLRRNMLKNIQSSRVKSNILRIIIRTSIDYAAQVNAYSTAQVRHKNAKREHYSDYTPKKGGEHHPYAYAYYGGHYGRITLNDPLAIGHFFDKMLLYVQKKVLLNLTTIKRKYSLKTHLKYKELKVVKL